ncbi:epimerase [Enterobacter sp. A11]|uniref:epimerase n=1 Tax=unclassified Enterobacter TaxID=2608935 RepID=UPI00107002A3|nr:MULTISPECIES: epimerase [unclassified Enterobacter]MBM1020196.1 epimerase [Enterobacter sp. E1]MEA3561496.1 epimerase [Enterobacter sp. GM-22]MEA3595207.1 epimerase [Enterobacter sp. GM-31]TFF60344.1 epimerase [Enterobacter sp. A11]
MQTLHPSLASADPLILGETLIRLNALPVGTLHIDIEDTSFISNITFGMKTINAVAHSTPHLLSFHLMLANPRPWLEWIAPLRPGWIFFHAEALANPAEDLAAIRRTGAKTGLALNPATPVASYAYLREHLDGLLIMTSEPDGEGQRFIPAMVGKVADAAARFPKTAIWADGGVDPAVAPALRKSGAQHLVLGRTVFSHSDISRALQAFAGE